LEARVQNYDFENHTDHCNRAVWAAVALQGRFDKSPCSVTKGVHPGHVTVLSRSRLGNLYAFQAAVALRYRKCTASRRDPISAVLFSASDASRNAYHLQARSAPDWFSARGIQLLVGTAQRPLVSNKTISTSAKIETIQNTVKSNAIELFKTNLCAQNTSTSTTWDVTSFLKSKSRRRPFVWSQKPKIQTLLNRIRPTNSS